MRKARIAVADLLVADEIVKPSAYPGRVFRVRKVSGRYEIMVQQGADEVTFIRSDTSTVWIEIP